MFSYTVSGKTEVFYDGLKQGSPYLAKIPRNHDSIFFVKKGQVLYERKGEKTLITAGQIGYIARGSSDKSSAYMCDETSYITIDFNFVPYGEKAEKTLPFKTLCSDGNAYGYERLFDEILYTNSSGLPGKDVVCNGILLQIIGLLYNEYEIDVEVLRKLKKIENAVNHLKKHYGNSELKISYLAETVNMSEKNFRRIFNEVYNKSPYAYLQEFRISRAQTLLLFGANSVSDIALMCGFSDVYSFSHSFKKHFGVSPTEYVKRQRLY